MQRRTFSSTCSRKLEGAWKRCRLCSTADFGAMCRCSSCAICSRNRLRGAMRGKKSCSVERIQAFNSSVTGMTCKLSSRASCPPQATGCKEESGMQLQRSGAGVSIYVCDRLDTCVSSCLIGYCHTSKYLGSEIVGSIRHDSWGNDVEYVALWLRIDGSG